MVVLRQPTGGTVRPPKRPSDRCKEIYWPAIIGVGGPLPHPSNTMMYFNEI